MKLGNFPMPDADDPGILSGHQKKLSGILLRAFQSRHCFDEDLFRR